MHCWKQSKRQRMNTVDNNSHRSHPNAGCRLSMEILLGSNRKPLNMYISSGMNGLMQRNFGKSSNSDYICCEAPHGSGAIPTHPSGCNTISQALKTYELTWLRIEITQSHHTVSISPEIYNSIFLDLSTNSVKKKCGMTRHLSALIST